jgi:hypothetical protein
MMTTYPLIRLYSSVIILIDFSSPVNQFRHQPSSTLFQLLLPDNFFPGYQAVTGVAEKALGAL